MNFSIGFIVVPIVFVIGIVGSLFLRYSSWGRKYRERKLMRHATRSPAYRKILEEHNQKLSVEVKKREAEERETENGVPVWFSRYIHRGQLKHWVLIINEIKYELRKDDATNTYIHSVKRHPGWNSVQEKRAAALIERHIPDVDGFYICLIGWTRLSDTELENHCRTLMQEKFTSYNMLWRNCQDFLQQFADRIVSSKATDWSWFRENTKTEYQSSQQLPEPPESILQAQANLQHHHGHHNLHQQTQQQLNNQIQVSNQIQLQVQMANSQAMQAGFIGGLPPGVGGMTG